MGKVIADLAASATSATFSVENATSSVNYVLSKTDGSANDHLKTDGSGNLAWVAPPAGGLTTASQWRLHTGFTGAAAPIASNLEEVDAPVGFGILGSSMTESSGIFTFPSTGYWLIDFHSNCNSSGNVFYRNIRIMTTTNDSTYVEAADGYSCIAIGTTGTFYMGADAKYIFDVTDTANCKVQFKVSVSGATVTTVGNTDENQTYMTFTKLADT